MKRRLGRSLWVTALALMWVGAASWLGASPVSAAPSVSLVPSLHVVGGPVSAGNRVVVMYVDSSKNLHLAGIDPVSGKVVWQHPYSATGVTPGVALTPSVIGNVVADVAPAGKPKDPSVNLSGINATTGAVLWRGAASFIPTDAPAPCGANTYFCIPGYNEDGSTSLLELDPLTGVGHGLLKGPSRLIGTDLYETHASNDTLEQLAPSGAKAWQSTVASLFGPGFSPDYGWIVIPTDTLDITMFEPVYNGNGYNVSSEKTMGLDLTTGASKWTLPDEYLCGGSLFFLDTPVACQFRGIVRKAAVGKKSPSFKGLVVSLVGFNPDTGAVTWTVPVTDIEAVLYGTGLAFLDDTHVLVTSGNGDQAVLDTTDGSTVAPSPRAVYWCQKNPSYSVNVSKDYSDEASRTSTTLYYGCGANGKASTTVPTTTPDSVGITVDGMFVWPTPHGLRARVVGTPQSFT